LYGATYNRFCTSDDHGATWTIRPAPFPNRIWRLAATRDRIFAAAYSAGILGSDDGGNTWTEFNRGLPYLNVYALAPASNGDLYAGTANGKVARLLRGASIWEERASLPPAVWEILPDAGDRLFAATTEGIWSTDDLAGTWIDRSEGLPSLRVYGLAFNRRRELVAALPHEGVEVARSTPATRAVGRTTALRTYPNPFNHRTIVQVSVASSVYLTVRLFDLLGRPVTTVFNGLAAPGELLVPINGSTLSTGMYFVVVEGAGMNDIQKILLLR
jgi:ligand-binding sensor domain-containing protein